MLRDIFTVRPRSTTPRGVIDRGAMPLGAYGLVPRLTATLMGAMLIGLKVKQ
jgi:hypothetical protein